LQGKAPKEIHAIMAETLACLLPGRAKDLSALLHMFRLKQVALLTKFAQIPGIRKSAFTPTLVRKFAENKSVCVVHWPSPFCSMAAKFGALEKK